MDPRALLRQWDIQPAKRLGQNFLVDQAALQRIVDGAEIDGQTVVLEIGAGLGALTEKLCRTAKRVVAVELDERLMPVLRENLGGADNVTLLQGDILEIDPPALVLAESGSGNGGSYVVVANLPYYITSAVLRHLLEASPRPERIVVTVQREVADRIVAKPGEMSLLSLSVQFYGRPRVLFRIKSGSFYPPPAVESAVVRIDVRPASELDAVDSASLFRVAQAGFSQRRKQLRNALAAGLRLPSAEVVARLDHVGVDATRRAQSLSLDEWRSVANVLGEPSSGP
jgi:16S rRNA (adenine1518-N6/adenine1519-N6)-dimethyltransferase